MDKNYNNDDIDFLGISELTKMNELLKKIDPEEDVLGDTVELVKKQMEIVNSENKDKSDKKYN